MQVLVALPPPAQKFHPGGSGVGVGVGLPAPEPGGQHCPTLKPLLVPQSPPLYISEKLQVPNVRQTPPIAPQCLQHCPVVHVPGAVESPEGQLVPCVVLAEQ